jgi:late competence protein required for DNA uptake (superfamily II DNA/RNA helicase)
MEFKLDFSLKRIFILGDTGSGKSTGVLKNVLGQGINKLVFYITTRRSELTEKEEYIRANFPEYNIIVHETDEIIGAKHPDMNEIHLMTIEKALFYLLNNSPTGMPIFILDEIDSISQNRNYEILVSYINTFFKENNVIYISAVVSINYIKNELSDFFMLDLSNPGSIISLGKNIRRIVTKFIKTDHMAKDIDKYIKLYADNPAQFNQTIIIIPSISKIEKVIKSEIMKSGIFQRPHRYIQDILEDKNTHIIDDIERIALYHNIGIIHSRIGYQDRKLVMDLFNEKKINIIISTSSIERGINLSSNSMFVFESDYIGQWNDSQIINFYGRLNRLAEGKNMIGYFYLISSVRDMYNFRKITDNFGTKIISSLTPGGFYFYKINYPEMYDHIMNKIPEDEFNRYEQYRDYAISIKFSLSLGVIARTISHIKRFLIPENTFIDDVNCLNEIMKSIGSKKLEKNMIRYIWYLLSKDVIDKKIDEKSWKEKIKSLIYTVYKNEYNISNMQKRDSEKYELKKFLTIQTLKSYDSILKVESIFGRHEMKK